MASIVVVCSVCRTSMRLGEAITEQKKVRCTGCRTVIVLDPNPVDPRDPIASYPKKHDKTALGKDKLGRIALYVTFGALCVFMITVLALTFRTTPTRGSVEGNVTLDGEKMKKGKIRFESLDGKNISATADIKDGKYSIPATATSGPNIGLNKVKITCIERVDGVDVDKVAERFNYPDPRYSVTVKGGSNSFSFDPQSK